MLRRGVADVTALTSTGADTFAAAYTDGTAHRWSVREPAAREMLEFSGLRVLGDWWEKVMILLHPHTYTHPVNSCRTRV